MSSGAKYVNGVHMKQTNSYFSEITCSPLLLPKKAVVNPRFYLPVYGTVATFTCEQNYFLTGNSTLRCEDVNEDGKGEWSSDLPSCQRKILITIINLLYIIGIWT